MIQGSSGLQNIEKQQCLSPQIRATLYEDWHIVEKGLIGATLNPYIRVQDATVLFKGHLIYYTSGNQSQSYINTLANESPASGVSRYAVGISNASQTYAVYGDFLNLGNTLEFWYTNFENVSRNVIIRKMVSSDGYQWGNTQTMYTGASASLSVAIGSLHMVGESSAVFTYSPDQQTAIAITEKTGVSAYTGKFLYSDYNGYIATGLGLACLQKNNKKLIKFTKHIANFTKNNFSPAFALPACYSCVSNILYDGSNIFPASDEHSYIKNPYLQLPDVSMVRLSHTSQGISYSYYLEQYRQFSLETSSGTTLSNFTDYFILNTVDVDWNISKNCIEVIQYGTSRAEFNGVDDPGSPSVVYGISNGLERLTILYSDADSSNKYMIIEKESNCIDMTGDIMSYVNSNNERISLTLGNQR